jgi:hypothetical protein
MRKQKHRISDRKLREIEEQDRWDKEQKRRQQEAAREWFNTCSEYRLNECVSVTLSFKQSIRVRKSRTAPFTLLDRGIAEKNMRHFLNVLNKKTFGNLVKKKGKKLLSIPVYEESETVRFHAHLILEKPKHKDLEEFAKLVNECWGKCYFGYKNTDIKQARDCGWLDYILKDKTKIDGVIEAIDILNCHLGDHRLDIDVC